MRLAGEVHVTRGAFTPSARQGRVLRRRRERRAGCKATKEAKREIMETSRKCQRSDSLKKAERAKGLPGSAKNNIGQTAPRAKSPATGIQRQPDQ